MNNKLLTGLLIIGLGTVLILFYKTVLDHPVLMIGGLVLANVLVSIKNKLRRR